MNTAWKLFLSLVLVTAVWTTGMYFYREQTAVQNAQVAVSDLQEQVQALAAATRPPSRLQSAKGSWALTVASPTDVYLGPRHTFYVTARVPRGTWIVVQWAHHGWDYVDLPSIHRVGYVPTTEILDVSHGAL